PQTRKAPGVSPEQLHFRPSTSRRKPGKLQASAWSSFTFDLRTIGSACRSKASYHGLTPAGFCSPLTLLVGRKRATTGLRPLASALLSLFLQVESALPRLTPAGFTLLVGRKRAITAYTR